MRRKSICFSRLFNARSTAIHPCHGTNLHTVIITGMRGHIMINNMYVLISTRVSHDDEQDYHNNVFLHELQSHFQFRSTVATVRRKVLAVFSAGADRAHRGAPPTDKEVLNHPEQKVQTGAVQLGGYTHTHAATCCDSGVNHRSVCVPLLMC